MIERNLPTILKKIAENDDKKAFSLFKHYHSKLLRITLLFVSSPQVAEDIVSEVLIKLLKNRKETFNKSNFIGYLYQCVKNHALDHIKRNKRQPIIDINYNEADYFIVEKSNPQNLLIYKEFEKLVSEVIEKFPPKRKLVFKMIKEDGLTYKKAAILLGISERTVEVHLRLAMCQLKISVENYLDKNKDNPPSHLSMIKLAGLLFLTSQLVRI